MGVKSSSIAAHSACRVRVRTRYCRPVPVLDDKSMWHIDPKDLAEARKRSTKRGGTRTVHISRLHHTVIELLGAGNPETGERARSKKQVLEDLIEAEWQRRQSRPAA